jgi:hypothetical protein
MDPVTLAIIMVALGWATKEAIKEGGRSIGERFDRHKEALHDGMNAWRARHGRDPIKPAGSSIAGKAIRAGIAGGAVVGTAAVAGVVGARGFGRGAAAGYRLGKAKGNARWGRATHTATQATPPGATPGNTTTPPGTAGDATPAGPLPVIDAEVVDDTEYAPQAPVDDTMPCPVCHRLMDAQHCQFCEGTGTVEAVLGMPTERATYRITRQPDGHPLGNSADVFGDADLHHRLNEAAQLGQTITVQQLDAAGNAIGTPVIYTPPAPLPAATETQSEPVQEHHVSNDLAANDNIPAPSSFPAINSQPMAVANGGGGHPLDADGIVVTYEQHQRNLGQLQRVAAAEMNSAELTMQSAEAAERRANELVASLEYVTAGLGRDGSDFGPTHQQNVYAIAEQVDVLRSHAAASKQIAAQTMEAAGNIIAMCQAAAASFVSDNQPLAEAHASAPHAGRREAYVQS